MSGLVGRDRPRETFESSALDALRREESADEKVEGGAVPLLEMVFLLRGAPYR